VGKRVLGKGLDALFAGGENLRANENEVDLDSIVVKGNQPRKVFNQESLDEMAVSIKEHGVLQPLLVRPLDNGKYELVAGERRLRASILAGLERVPVVVRDMDEPVAWEAALIENLQRENLNPIEEAAAYREMLDRHGYTQEELAKKIGKSRAHVSNTVRILNLPEEIREMIADGKLTAGHARAILSIKDEEEQISLAHKIIGQGLSVRDSEQAGTEEIRKRKVTQSIKDPNLLMAEQRFEEFLNTKVRVIKKKSGGKIEVSFHDDEELNRIMEILGLV
jgi:ParB family chromosome partitioning protein